MSFGVPSLLWLALLAPVAAAAAAWLWRRRLRDDAAWASRGLWDRLLPAYVPRRLTLSVATLALAVLGTSLALARPRWGLSEQTVERKGVDVVFVVDSSLSMGALDVSPSRLFVAKSLVLRMVREMPGNRLGLVQTEGDGVVLAPLTLDGGVLELLLDTIDPGSLPVPGTELAPGMDAALRLFGQESGKHRVLILLSDGEDHGGGMESETNRLRELGVIVHTVGVGTPTGAPVPVPGAMGEVKKESDGSVVVSRLNEDMLQNLARATGGTYLRATTAAADPAQILRAVDGMEKRIVESRDMSTLEERFQWPLALAVLALLLHLGVGPFAPEKPRPAAAPVPARARRGASRRSVPALMLIGFALPSLPSFLDPHLPAWAERLLYNPRERTGQVIDAYGKGEPREALEKAETALRIDPEDPAVQYNAGTAHLATGNERKAIALLEKAARDVPADLSPTAHYNLGNARLAAGDASGAVQAYKQTLRAAPSHAAAKHNLELALREEQKQKKGLQSPRAGNRGRRTPNDDPSNRQGKGGNPDENPPRDQKQPPSPQQQGGQPRPGEGGERDERLPQFRNQPEMSAREAASVLAAVENLERQQRRDQAAKRARMRAVKGKDW
jgi:tetratricopeptide (TPR) repeat protein